jgi:hypothetical protein
MPKEINPKTLFLDLQKSLIAELEMSKSAINHPGTKGNATETNWISMLEKYLPKRYQASNAFVIDCKGGISEQQDIVIHDRQYSPFLLNHAGALYIPAESVYAVLEVKQNLNANHIKYAGAKIKSVRSLYRTNAKIIHAGGKYEEPRELFPILGGLLTLESDWSPAFGKAFTDSINNLPILGRFDLGCSIKNGSYEITYEKEKPIVKIKEGDVALLSFFLRLLARLQNLGTVPAMDISAYENWIY